MPALRAFGRRWSLGSDDFVIPGMMEILIRLAWVIILVVVFLLNLRHHHKDPDGPSEECWEETKLMWFYGGTATLLVIHIAIGAATVSISARGTIKKTAPRRPLAGTLYARLVFLVPELACSVFGAWLTFRDDFDSCQRYLIKAGRGVVVVEWILLITIAIAVAFMFDPLGKRHMRKKSTKDLEKVWKRRCRILCCCCLAGDENRQNAFEEIADLLAKFFKGKDIVFTDIVAGMILLNAQQRFRPPVSLLAHRKLDQEDSDSQLGRYDALPRTPSATNTATDRATNGHVPRADGDGIECNHNDVTTDAKPDVDADNDTEATGFISISVGGRRFNAGDSCQASTSSSSETSSRRSSVDGGDVIDGRRPGRAPDNLPRPASTPKDWMTLENAEYYSKYAVGIYAKYNYVMFKNCSQRLPLCRRYRCCGQKPTLSESQMTGDNSCDCQTAALLHYTRINPDDIIYANFDNQIYETPYFIALDSTRKSVVIAIRGTKTFQDAVTDLTAFGEALDLEGVPAGNVHSGILRVAKHIKGELDKINFPAQVPEGYNVIVTGHSLGAGAAVILSMILRKDYPELKCFAFSPPGGLVSLNLQFYTEDFVCSVVLGNDLVPRLSLDSMESFKENLLRVLKHCKVPKYKILGRGMRALCCGWDNSISEDLLVDIPANRQAQLRKGTEASQSKASIVTRRLFDFGGGGSSRSKRSADGYSTPPKSSTNGGSRDPSAIVRVDTSASADMVGQLSAAPSAVSLAVDVDSDVSSIASDFSHILRHKDTDEAGGVSERPTTFHQFKKSHTKWKREREGRLTGLRGGDPLYLPGHIMHIIEEAPVRQLSKPTYRAQWSCAKEFCEIAVGPNMTHHHHGYVLSDVLSQMLRKKAYTVTIGSSLGTAAVSRQPEHVSIDMPVNTDDGHLHPSACGATAT